ncbi:MAG TPA: bifunctional 3,4-dihydroxy-2-butanone-4-phosphate synthase/GTP cyclohydrolase II [Candidatus Polarisedimenticolia bacterium]|nr:bifunctional 3,4-dihydroxy-2-butanone-4-phosphate synthase/GTP cyclohydrolase II [Candidatus Polarisedimenticolia bacterium]
MEEAIEEIREGRMIVIVDDEDRENEGDLAVAAEKITTQHVNFMARHGRGLICLPMSEERLRQLDVPLMVEKNTSPYGTAFCVSIEARHGVSTGISAADRARTIKVAVDPATRPSDLARPGHVFPLMAVRGGVLKRPGQTEAIVDLARLAGLQPAGVICEVMNEDGTMARVPELSAFSRKHGLKMISVAALIRYRMRTERLIRRVAAPMLPTGYGAFRLVAYRSDLEDKTHLALVLGEIGMDDPTLVRLHSECLTGDVFGSLRCDCGLQLDKAMELISREGKGIIVYLRQEGRGIGLENKLRAYELQDQGKDTVEANESLGFKPDQRDYGIGAQILSDLGVNQIRLMTNNPDKFIGLRGFGIEIVDRVPLEVPSSGPALEYLRVKKEKLGHFLSV